MSNQSTSVRLIMARGNRNKEEVCKAVGITEKALSAYESGDRIPRDEVKQKLAELYGIEAGKLFY